MTDKSAQIETARSLYDEALMLREYAALLREHDIPYTRNYGFEGRRSTGRTRTRIEVLVAGEVVGVFHR